MQNEKKTFRKTEIFLLLFGLFLSLVFLLVNTNFWQLLFGYFICFFTFTLSSEIYFILFHSKLHKWSYIFSSNLKLVIIGVLIYTTSLAGISADNLVYGFIICQTIAIILLSIIEYLEISKKYCNLVNKK
jgi:O-antigen/teichoic acid export membrane protein